jgi:hypothetical protein
MRLSPIWRWQIVFFSNIILLNILLFLREAAHKGSWFFYITWSVLVACTGGLIIWSFFRLRRCRSEAATAPTQNASPPAKHTAPSQRSPRKMRKKKKK